MGRGGGLGLHGIGCMGQGLEAIVLNAGLPSSATEILLQASFVTQSFAFIYGSKVFDDGVVDIRFDVAQLTDQTCGHKEQRSLPSCQFR